MAYRRRSRSQMAAAFPDALVTGLEPLEPTIDPPDPDDAHVVAAALTGGAHVIVTDDQHGFTRPLPGNLTVETTDEFASAAEPTCLGGCAAP